MGEYSAWSAPSTFSHSLDPELAREVRWDDPAFAIAWPCPPTAISERDRGYPDFAPQAAR